ncbi:MAG TPA: hypothetical protein VFV23_09065 [Verrucomicrobiae bacterium]|nr:hypothetical protein [Verrucomicrobiae bacterium]
MKRNHKPWTNVATFEDFKTAGMLENSFKRRGIEARTFNDRLLQLFLFLCPPRVTFHVQVRQNDYKRATDFMDADKNVASILEQAIHCPACGSLHVSYPQMTRKFFLPTLLLHLGILLRVTEHEAYCEFCHNVWNLPKENPGATSKKAHAT